MTARRRATTSVVPIAVTALFVLVVAAAKWQGAPAVTRSVLDDLSAPEAPAVTLPPVEVGEAEPPVVGSPLLESLVSAVGTVLGFVLLAVVAVVLVLVVRRLLRARPAARRAGASLTEEASAATRDEAAVDAPAVRRGIDGAIARISSLHEPHDAVIVAWVGLEEAAGESGRPRGPAETPAEFARRIVGTRPDAREDLEALLGLYEAVRFGGARSSGRDRDDALTRLRRIREAWA